MEFGILLADVPRNIPAKQQFADILRIADAAQRNGFTYIAIGQHFLYGDLRWLQPVPLLARLSAELDPEVKVVTHVMIGPLYHPVVLAEEVATLDIVTEGRLCFGVGLGYRAEEFDYFGVPYEERGPRLDESLELIVRLWTEDKVTHHGRFYDVVDVQPHIQPVQQPYPPMWIGGHSRLGARRAGRIGDAFLVPPETTHAELADRFRIVAEGFAARGKPFGPQPVRRQVLVAKDRQTALDEFARVAKGRYITYAQRGLDLFAPQALEADFVAAAEQHAVLGSADEVTSKLADFAATFPVSPVIVKPQWPVMDADETIATLDLLGSTIVANLRDVEPTTSINYVDAAN